MAGEICRDPEWPAAEHARHSQRKRLSQRSRWVSRSSVALYVGICSLSSRGSQENLKSLMDQKRIGAYVGIDPTAPSLHVGHLVPLMALFWMYIHGFQSVTLVSLLAMPTYLCLILTIVDWRRDRQCGRSDGANQRPRIHVSSREKSEHGHYALPVESVVDEHREIRSEVWL